MRYALVLLVLALFTPGCDLLGQTSEVEVQFGGFDGFDHDFVTISAGPDTIFAGTVVSPGGAGVWAFETKHMLPRRLLSIRITVNDLETRVVPLDTRRWRALWVDFNREEERVVVTTHPHFLLPEG